MIKSIIKRFLAFIAGIVVWGSAFGMSWIICNLANLSIEDNVFKLFYVTFFVALTIAMNIVCFWDSKPTSSKDAVTYILIAIGLSLVICIFFSAFAFIMNLIFKYGGFFITYAKIWLLIAILGGCAFGFDKPEERSMCY